MSEGKYGTREVNKSQTTIGPNYVHVSEVKRELAEKTVHLFCVVL